jgi:anti-anti-sigma regulatory factor
MVSMEKKRKTPRSRKKGASGKATTAAVACVRLPETLDMRAARELKRVLEISFGGNQPCILEASAVGTISTGCAQILAAFARSMNASSKKVTLRKPTASMLKTFELLGMTKALSTYTVEA